MNYTVSKMLYRDESFIYYASESKSGESVVIAEFAPVQTDDAEYAALAAEKQNSINALSSFMLNSDFLKAADSFYFDGKLFILSAPADTFTIRERLSAGVYRPEHAFGLVLPFIKSLDNTCKSNLAYTHLSPDNTSVTNGRLTLLQFGKMSPSKTIDSIRAAAGLAYFLLTGKEHQAAAAPPSQLGIALPPSVEAVLMRALNDDEHTNFRTLFEFHESLAEKLNKPGVPANETAAPRKEVKTGNLALAVGGIIVVVLALIAGLAWAVTGIVGNISFAGKPEPEPTAMRVETPVESLSPTSPAPATEAVPIQSASPDESTGEEEDPDAYLYYTMLITDTNDNSVILNGTAAENSNYLYYKVWTEDSYGIIREDKQSGVKELIADSVLPSFIITTETRLFYNDAFQGYGLVMCGADGSNPELIISDTCLYPVLDEKENALFYSNYGYGEIVRYSLDDGSFRVIANESASELILYGGYLYYTNMRDEFLYRVKTDGSGNELWSAERMYRIVPHGGKLYYVSNADGFLYSFDLVSRDIEEIITGEYVYDMAIDGSMVYFVSESRDFALCAYDTITSDIAVLYEDDLSYLLLLNGQLYYVSDLESALLLRCDFDGDRREIIGY